MSFWLATQVVVKVAEVAVGFLLQFQSDLGVDIWFLLPSLAFVSEGFLLDVVVEFFQ